MAFLNDARRTSVTRTVFWRAQAAALLPVIVVAEGADQLWPPITFALILTVAAAELFLIALRLRDSQASLWLILIPCVAIVVPAPAGLWFAAATMRDSELGALLPPILGLILSLLVCSAFLIWVGFLPTRTDPR